MSSRYTVVALDIRREGTYMSSFFTDHETDSTQVFNRGTENVRKAIKDMQSYIDELIYADFKRRKEIRKEAQTCDDLMNYSYEVADTSSKLWKTLSELVGRILIATSGDYMLE